MGTAPVGLRDRQLGTPPWSLQLGAALKEVHLCTLTSVCTAHPEKWGSRGCEVSKGPLGAGARSANGQEG